MIISSFNIQNNINNYSIDKTKDIVRFLEENNIDILGLQEVFSPCDNDLERLFPKNYSMVGKYRFFLQFIFKKINEKTPIVTKYKIIKYKTYRLPHLPSLLKRVMTKVIIDIDGEMVSVYNTHLDFKSMIARKRELKKILRIIRRDVNPIILLGDFNLKNNKQMFIDFEYELNKIGIRRVSFNEKTLKVSQYKREIDHIFLSYDFRLISKKVVKDLEISDHYPVVIEITKY